MRQVYNGLSVLLIALVGIFIAATAISYNSFIQAPLQGGWNSYRYREFGMQITPYILIFFSLLTTRFRICPKWIFFVAITLLLLFSALFVLTEVYVALTLRIGAGITALLFILLLSAHLRFISYSGQS
jgi:hypothetical protein